MAIGRDVLESTGGMRELAEAGYERHERETEVAKGDGCVGLSFRVSSGVSELKSGADEKDQTIALLRRKWLV